MSRKRYDFVVSKARESEFESGLRPFFDYRDLGIKKATGGDFTAHIIRAAEAVGRGETEGTGRHYHEVDFQMVFVLKGWVTFWYDGEGEFTFRQDDSVLQPSGIRHALVACSDDLEMLEIVAPGEFATHDAEGERAAAE